MESEKTLPTHSYWTVIKRGACGFCPNCGRGKLFWKYLKQVDSCSECGEEYRHIRADDGPAWLTIIVVAHIAGPLLPLMVMYSSLPDWLSLAICLVLSTILMLLLLPRAKGFFIAMIWRMKGAGAEK